MMQTPDISGSMTAMLSVTTCHSNKKATKPCNPGERGASQIYYRWGITKYDHVGTRSFRFFKDLSKISFLFKILAKESFKIHYSQIQAPIRSFIIIIIALCASRHIRP